MDTRKSHDWIMPRKIDTGLPADLQFAIDAFGSAARVQLIRDLQRRGPASIPTLAGRLDLNEHTVRANLRALEVAGVVKGDIPPELRGSTAVTYRAQRSRCAELLMILRTNILLLPSD